MSKWVECKITLKAKILDSPEAKELLKQAIMKVMEKHGIKATIRENSLVVGYGVKQLCPIHVEFKHTWGNGFGIAAKEDELIFVGDTHGIEDKYRVSLNQLAQEIMQTYTELAIEKAMELAGYAKVEESETEENKHLVFVKVF